MVRKIAFAVMLGLMLSLSIWVQAQAPVTIGVSFNEAVGAYLTDGDGNTLYVFTQDVANVSNCADNCAVNWPPVVVPGADAVSGVEGLAGSLTTFARADNGSLQVAYNRQPLYTFASDTAPGQVNGEGVGGVWFVARPQIVSLGAVDGMGSVLVDGQGRSLYTFANDSEGVSNCADACLENWPALSIGREAELNAGLGAVSQSSLGLITRADTGALQVTYDGLPLYTFVGDSEPGMATGDGLNGVWSLVRPAPLQIGQSASFGDILVGSDGMTLYTFANDPEFDTACVDQCALNWPPLTIASPADLSMVDTSVLSADISYITRPDGSTQVTYDGAPLYGFIGDGVPGETNGHNRNDVWFVVPLSAGAAPMFTCSVVAHNNVNLRNGPGTNYNRAGIFTGGESRFVVGQAVGADGFVWWQMEDSLWVRSDIVRVDGACEDVPTVAAPPAPAAPPPAATAESQSSGSNEPPPPETTEEVD
ncbi:MAG: hypothetical protein KC708_25095 [Anaerolineae bacterium]|nr:hypothetical protein [Anaerolineae bacterium]